MSGRSLGVLEGLWEVFHLNVALGCLKRVREVSGGSLEVSWRYLKGLWEVSGRSLGGFWEVSGRLEVLDSKSDVSLSENAKSLPTLVTLPCVFEGQSNLML